jgi:bacterioferritin
MMGNDMLSNARSTELASAYPFLSNLVEVRQRTRRHIQDGASPAPANEGDTVLRLLNDVLLAESMCLQRLRLHRFDGDNGAVGAEILRLAEEGQARTEQLQARILQLGGTVAAAEFADGHAEYDEEEDSLTDSLAEDLIAERIAIDSYRDIIAYLGGVDSTTQALFESLLERVLHRANELARIRRGLLHGSHAAAAQTFTAPGELQ